MDLQHKNRVAIAIAEKHNLEIDDAIDRMESASVWLISNESIKSSRTLQVSFLTAVNIAKRVFLGGVKCVFPNDVPNLLDFGNKDFSKLVERFGGTLSVNDLPGKSQIKILFGIECFDNNCIESVASGWRGGLNFYGQERIVLGEVNSQIFLGSIAAASLACYKAFSKIYKLQEEGIDLNLGISLWNLNSGDDWAKMDNDGPTKIYLPRNLWILGLGHLGQAYIWSMGLMGVKSPDSITFLLQDYQTIDKENIGPQVLSSSKYFGYPKTRPCISYLEDFGFKTRIVEKPFQKEDLENEWVQDFKFLLNGVDNIPTRKAINKEFLDLFIDAATNGRLSLFDSFTMRNVKFTNKEPDELWPSNGDKEEIFHPNLFQKNEKKRICGKLTNYNIATPFVGLFGSTIVIAELLRALNKGRRYSIVSLQMRDVKSIQAIENGFYSTEYLRNAIGN